MSSSATSSITLGGSTVSVVQRRGAAPSVAASGPAPRNDYVVLLVLEGAVRWKYPAAIYFCDDAVPPPAEPTAAGKFGDDFPVTCCDGNSKTLIFTSERAPLSLSGFSCV